MTATVAIVGGGLSGLYAAALLEQRGVHDYVLLEGRSRLGGRLESVASGCGTAANPDACARRNRFDLGAAWLWPTAQPDLARLVKALGLELIPQYEQGDVVYENASGASPTRARGYGMMHASVRIAGGMQAVVDALLERVDRRRIMLDTEVTALRLVNGGAEVTSRSAVGDITLRTVAHVFLALPPRLASTRIEFAPPWPARLAREWRQTPTWMAPHAKYIAIYDRPFWREQGLSGGARSMVGPLAEVLDVSCPGGDAALFGFLAWPSQVRRQLGDEALRARCRTQLERLFGAEAGQPKFELLRDWSVEPYTATSDDAAIGAGHVIAPAAGAMEGPWRGRVTGIASEWSPDFPGLVAGAIDAAQRGVDAWLADCHARTAASPDTEPANACLNNRSES